MCCSHHVQYSGGSCWPGACVCFCPGAPLNQGLEVQPHTRAEVTAWTSNSLPEHGSGIEAHCGFTEVSGCLCKGGGVSV